MTKSQIVIGGIYTARVSERLVNVRVDRILDTTKDTLSGYRTTTLYEVTNLKTGRKLVFHSSQKFRAPAKTTG